MEQLSLFSQEVNMSAPLASRLRPQSLNDYIGQEHLVGPGKVLRQILDNDKLHDILGASGCGENHAGKDYREYDTGVIYRFQCCHKRY